MTTHQSPEKRNLRTLGAALLLTPLLSIAGEPAMKHEPVAATVALLNSIETGDSAAVAIINPGQYIQHNPAVADGLQGFAALLQSLPAGSARVNVVRAFRDGDYVFTHSEYQLPDALVGFDIFRFEEGKIVEHWDNLQPRVSDTVSGRSQTDGPVEASDHELTTANKTLVNGFVNDVLMGKAPERITDYIEPEHYLQHNPAVGDGLAALGDALTAMAEAGTPMVYQRNHLILGEGNFVLAVSEGEFLGAHSAFYDLFRIENGRIVEHWDTVQTIPPEDEHLNRNGKFGRFR